MKAPLTEEQFRNLLGGISKHIADKMKIFKIALIVMAISAIAICLSFLFCLALIWAINTLYGGTLIEESLTNAFAVMIVLMVIGSLMKSKVEVKK